MMWFLNLLELPTAAFQLGVAAGLTILAGGFLWTQGLRRGRDRGQPFHDNQDSTPATRHAALVRHGSAVVSQVQLRLATFSSEVEQKLQARAEQLDRLIVDADREILRLEELLAESRQATPGTVRLARQADAVFTIAKRDAA